MAFKGPALTHDLTAKAGFTTHAPQGWDDKQEGWVHPKGPDQTPSRRPRKGAQRTRKGGSKVCPHLVALSSGFHSHRHRVSFPRLAWGGGSQSGEGPNPDPAKFIPHACTKGALVSLARPDPSTPGSLTLVGALIPTVHDCRWLPTNDTNES